MASSSPADAVTGAATAHASEKEAQDVPATTTEKAVEMSEVPASPTANEEEFKDAVQTQPPPSTTPTVAAEQPLPSRPLTSSEEPRMNRTQTSEALGPATDAPTAPPPSATAGASPTLSITLMLTTGARHPYKIDEKYLSSRKVEARSTATGAFDPTALSGYQLKELIWTDWRGEWEPRPTSPSSIRLIILGRMIEDKTALKDFPFNLAAANVVHMTVKPADLLDDEDATAKGTGKGGALRQRDGEDRGAGCRCVIL